MLWRTDQENNSLFHCLLASMFLMRNLHCFVSLFPYMKSYFPPLWFILIFSLSNSFSAFWLWHSQVGFSVHLTLFRVILLRWVGSFQQFYKSLATVSSNTHQLCELSPPPPQWCTWLTAGYCALSVRSSVPFFPLLFFLCMFRLDTWPSALCTHAYGSCLLPCCC